MKTTALDKVCNQVYRTHPEFAGCRPKVSMHSEGDFLLLFSTTAKVMGGKSINQTLRVIANDDGEILKISSSRG